MIPANDYNCVPLFQIRNVFGCLNLEKTNSKILASFSSWIVFRTLTTVTIAQERECPSPVPSSWMFASPHSVRHEAGTCRVG